VTSHQLEPYAGLLAAVGVALLLVERDARLRAFAILAFLVGAAPLAAAQGPSLARIEARPALAAAVVVGGVGMLVIATALALRFAWVVPILLICAGLRLPIRDPQHAVDSLLPIWALVIAGLAAVAWRAARGVAPPAPLGLFGWLLAAYELLAAASLFWTADLQRGAFEMFSIYLPFGILVVLIARGADAPRIMRAAPPVQISLACLFAVVAVWQYTNRDIFWNAKQKDLNIYASFFRVNSLFYDPSLYGRFEALALVTIVALALFAAPSRRVLVASGLAIVIFVGMLPSWSQTSFAALIGGVVFLAAVAFRRIVVVVLVAAVLVVVVVIAASQPQVMRVVNHSLNKASSSRVGLMQSGGQTFVHHPLIGVGLGGFSRATGRTAEQKQQIAAHNVFVSVAAELGVGGVALFMALLAVTIQALRRCDDRLVRVVLAAELVALVIHGVAYDQFWADPTWWTIMALAAATGTLAASSPPAAGTQASRELLA
jgi:hypothetical protein